MSDVVSVALITAIATLVASLGAVIITNIAASKRLYARLQHEKEEAIRERLTNRRAIYLEPLRDSLYELNLDIGTLLIPRMNKAAQDENATNLEALENLLEIIKKISEHTKVISLTGAKVTDIPLANLLDKLLGLQQNLFKDIKAKFEECKKSESLYPLKFSENIKNSIKMKKLLIESNERIEELLSGCDSS